jgi:hypothetical protein
VLASVPSFAQGLERNGYSIERHVPFWFRGRGNAPDAWHLTFLEGDLGFRK